MSKIAIPKGRLFLVVGDSLGAKVEVRLSSDQRWKVNRRGSYYRLNRGKGTTILLTEYRFNKYFTLEESDGSESRNT